MILFADDAKIYKSINSLNDHDILQHDINNLTKWLSDWILTLNSDKCKVFEDRIMTMSCRIIPYSLYPRRMTRRLYYILSCPLMHILMTMSANKIK